MGRTGRVSAPIAPPADLAGVQRAVLGWYERERRDLPFRRTRDPYLVLVSEVMAQQTQISRVAQAWPSFVGRYPTVALLAGAPLDDVVRAWSGLGYNRRAVQLHRAAREIVERHAGLVPDDPAVLATLPGIGPYTARAVAAIAFGRPVGAVDTNVRRVLGRAFDAGHGRAERTQPRGGRIQALADALVPENESAAWTAALMDVSAVHCRPRPRCDGCPLSSWCLARSELDRPPSSRRARSATRVPAFESTSRWLRGRIVERLRSAAPGTWQRFGTLGRHDERAVTEALAGLERDGLVERHPDDPGVARLAAA